MVEMILLLLFTIVIPGILIATGHSHIIKSKLLSPAFLKYALIYNLLINGTNIFFMQIFGWHFNKLSTDIMYLMKYLAAATVFGAFYIGTYSFINYMIHKKKLHIKGSLIKLFIIFLVSWVGTNLLSITVLTYFFPKAGDMVGFLESFALVFFILYALIFSVWYLYKQLSVDKIDRKRKLMWDIGITIGIFLVFGGILFYVIISQTAEMPMLVSENHLFELLCILIMNIAFGLFALCFIDIMKNRFHSHKLYRWIGTIYFFLFPAIAFVMIEVMINTAVFNDLVCIFGNLLIYYSIFLALHAVIRNKKVILILYGSICFLFGAADYFVYRFRGIPILPADIWSYKTAASVAGNYKYNLSVEFFIGMTLFLLQLVLIVLLFEKKKVDFKIRWYVRNVAICLASAGICFFILDSKAFSIEVNKWNKIGSYQAKGTALCIFNDIKASVVKMPEGYSAEKIEELYKKFQSTEDTTVSESEKPNIIVVMNESFSDLNVVKELSTSEDTMPFIHSLTENTIKGSVSVSVFGGNTCNTEFEFLTGNSLGFLPEGCIPFQQFITKKTDSISTTLKSQDYVSTAIHPYSRYGWRRSQVYPLVGLDTFYSRPEFTNPTLMRGYVSDKDSFNKITEVINQNSNARNFIFNVTMQNHGGFTNKVPLDNWIDITDSLVEYPDLEQYLTLIHTTDKAYEDLITYYKSIKTPTIILMFGDHQPNLGGTTYDYLYGDMEDAPLNEKQNKYKTPFIIWANYDIEEKEDVVLSPNYLSSYLLEVAGTKKTPFNEYLLELQKKIPAMNAFGYLGDDGNWYEYDEETPYSDELLEYQTIQYNNMFDSQNRVDEFFQVQD